MRFIFSLLLIFPYWVNAQVLDVEAISSSIMIPETDINTETFEFSPVFYGPYIAFVNDRGQNDGYDYIKNTPYFDLVFAGANVSGNLSKKASFEQALSSNYQEGPFCFTPSELKMYFTRTDPISGNLRIFSAERKNGDWVLIGEENISNNIEHICHPSISPDGYNMVFAGADSLHLDMDMYTTKMVNGEWSTPTKLSDNVNSENNDWFPRFINDTIIVFASDRLGGLGGLDQYAIKWSEGAWSDPQLLPAPINSPADDFGLIIGEEIAYFSSSRIKNAGKDDLYRIEFKGSLIYDESTQLTNIVFTILDKLSLQKIPNATIMASPVVISEVNNNGKYIDLDIPINMENQEMVMKLQEVDRLPSSSGFSNPQKLVELPLRSNQLYIIEIKADGYEKYRSLFSLEKLGRNITYVLEPDSGDLPLNKNDGVFIPTTRGSIVVFENIYYDFNSFNIQQGAALELDALADVMKSNPKMKIRLSAHTDSRGTLLYNQRLSDKRALSAKNYLIAKGIASSRIEAIGFGESQLRNLCEDGVTCSDEEHQYNRRTEVQILEN